MSDTPRTDALIRDVNPKSRNADYWILKHQRAVDLARQLERENAELRDALNAAAKVIEKAGYPEVARSFLAKPRS